MSDTRVIEKGKKYYIYSRETGAKHLALCIETEVPSAVDGRNLLRIIGNGQTLRLHRNDIFDYCWFDDYKPHLVSSIFSILAAVATAYIVVVLKLSS